VINSCFDRFILMFLMREGLECRISILSDEAVNRYQSTDFCFPLCRPSFQLGQLTSIDRENKYLNDSVIDSPFRQVFSIGTVAAYSAKYRALVTYKILE